MPLTHVKITFAKPRPKPYKPADAQQRYLVVQPSGAKLWRMNYRSAGRQKTVHSGAWPAVMAIALRLSPYLFVRPGELQQAEWAELDETAAV